MEGGGGQDEFRVGRDFPGGPVVKTPHPRSVQG